MMFDPRQAFEMNWKMGITFTQIQNIKKAAAAQKAKGWNSSKLYLPSWMVASDFCAGDLAGSLSDDHPQPPGPSWSLWTISAFLGVVMVCGCACCCRYCLWLWRRQKRQKRSFPV